MELDEFLKGSNKKLTENGLIKTLTEACEALEEEDGDDASEELMAFMEEHDIDIPWDSDEDDDDPDEEEDPDDEDEEEPDDDEEDDDESPDFSKMNIKELKAFAKENKIKGIAGLKKDELIELIESALEDEDPDDEEEPDDVDEDDIDEDDVDDEDEDDEYDELSLKEIKALMKKAGHSPKSIKKMDREEMIEHLKAADDEDEEEKEMSLEEILNETTKLADLQALVAEHDEFKGIRKKAKKIKGLQGPRELKPLMYKALGIEAPAKQKRTPKKDKTPKYTRGDAVIATIKKLGKKGFEMSDLLIKSDELFVEKTGGASNPTATNVCNSMVNALVGFDVLEKDGKKFKLA
jgi:hypothetical protein